MLLKRLFMRVTFLGIPCSGTRAGVVFIMSIARALLEEVEIFPENTFSESENVFSSLVSSV